MLHRRASVLAALAALAIAMGAAAPARAGGILAQELATPRGGTAQAGQAAYAYDAATAIYNPAGMARIKERKILVGVQPIVTDIEFDLDASTTFSGGDGDDQGGVVAGLGSYFVQPINDRFAVGAGMFGVAGGALSPDGDWAGRLFVTELQLIVIALNPVVSFRVNDWLSLGFGASVNYGRMDFEITTPNLMGPEGNVQFESIDDFEPSFNAGILIEPSENTRIGLAYRSKVDFDLTGDVDVNDPSPALQLLGLSSGDASAEIPLPHLIRLSLYQKLSDDLALLLDFGWEDWSVMDFTPITGEAGRELTIPRQWRDTFHYGIGLEWQATPSWLLQCGVAYDTDPTRDRSTTLPDLPADRQLRYSAGFVHDWSERVQVGLNYTFVDFGRSPVDVETPAGRLAGYYEDFHAHAIAATVQF